MYTWKLLLIISIYTLLGSVYLRVTFNLFYTILGSVYLRKIPLVFSTYILLGCVYRLLLIYFNLFYALLGSVYLKVTFNLFYTLLGSEFLGVIFNLSSIPFRVVYNLRLLLIFSTLSWLVYI